MTTTTNKDYAVLSTSPVRKGVPEKATGQAKYTGDISLPNMLYGAILHSPLAHAKILNIDISRAQKLPGVKAVLTAKEVSNLKFGHSPARFDETALAVEKVRHVGDEVAAVAAVDEQTAREALELIKVDYEELPILLNPVDALADNAILIHADHPRNICQEVHNEVGNVEKAFAEAYLVRTDKFANKKSDGACLEPQAALASFDLSGNLTLWTSTQVSHYVQRTVAIVLQMPVDKVRVIAPFVGGGFGVKASAGSHEIIAAMLSMNTHCPVRLVLDREEVFMHNRARHQFYHEMTMAVDKTGKIIGHKHLSVLDGGAYSSFGIATIYYNGSLLHAPYAIPNMRYDAYRVFTNKPASGALRGHGGLSNRACFEAQLDMIANEMKIDPVEMRIKNSVQAGDTTASGYYLSSFNMRECLKEARDSSEWVKKKNKLPKGKGIGVSTSYFVSGAGASIYRTDIPQSTVIIKVADDGNGVTVYTGSNEIGQGSDTVFGMITAEVLGLELDDVKVISGDTGLCPIDLGAYSSRQTLMTGQATKQAAEAVRDQILAKISKRYNMPVSEFKLRGSRVLGTEKNQEELSVIRNRYMFEHRHFTNLVTSGPLTFTEVARLIYADSGSILGKGTYRPPDIQYSKEWKGSVVGASPAYSTQTCIAEVTVDPNTGDLTIDHLTLAHDCGFAINRKSIEGQLEGSMCHGLSEALFEEMIFDNKGRQINPTLGDYKIPTSVDVPDMNAIIIESNEPNGPFGAKEVGEGCILPVVPAIINAIRDACGVVIMELPITSEKILKSLKAKEAAKADYYIYSPPAAADKILARAAELSKGSSAR
jgi:4-hydroxybenzoyl-CoA reductase subunit alpha